MVYAGFSTRDLRFKMILNPFEFSVSIGFMISEGLYILIAARKRHSLVPGLHSAGPYL
jgi:hypothetical protein